VKGRLDPERFIRTHRSTIVNVRRIKELQPAFHGNYVIVLDDNTEIPLTPGYRARLLGLFSAQA
jgi:two-component system LytT family response regulator